MGIFFDKLRLVFRNSEFFVIVTAFLISIFAMLPQVQSVSDLLWAEDGAIFATEAFSLGLKSIITPYAGYLHLFPRLIALTSTFAGIDFLPALFLGAWLFSVLYASLVIFLSLTSHDLKASTASLVCISIFVLPSSGEIYFNMTNSQWFLGLALCSYFIIPNKPLFNWWMDIFLLPLAVLTGPFCAILLPFASFKVIRISKNFRLWNWRIFILGVGTLVQAGYYLSSSRTGGTLDLNALHWLSAVDKFLTYGIVEFGFGISVLVWFGVAYVLKDRYTKNSDAKKIGFVLLALAFAFFAVSLWSTKGRPDVLHPMGGGARYYFVPYSLILLSWIFLLEWNGRLIKIILTVLICIGLLLGIVAKRQLATRASSRIAKAPIDYMAFLHLNRAGEAVDIQLNPFWDMYPSPWRITASIVPDLNSHAYRNILTSKDVIEVNGRFHMAKGFAIDDSNNDPYISFSVPYQCGGYDYIAVKAALTKEAKGPVELFWQTHTESYFTPEKSRSRFMPEGQSIVQFALQNRGVLAIRLDPTMDASKSSFQSIQVICYD